MTAFLFPDLPQGESPYPDPRDITARKHGGNPQSADAFDSVKDHLPAARARVLEKIRAAGVHGLTVKEIARALGKGLNAVSPRLTELLDAKAVKDSGRRRDGCRVLVVVKDV